MHSHIFSCPVKLIACLFRAKKARLCLHFSISPFAKSDDAWAVKIVERKEGKREGPLTDSTRLNRSHWAQQTLHKKLANSFSFFQGKRRRRQSALLTAHTSNHLVDRQDERKRRNGDVYPLLVFSQNWLKQYFFK